jgi:phosphoglycerol transferase MdoB-like AlkP superfamily enzyme
MIDFNTLAEISRTNCSGICAFLIPANILATSLTIILTVINRPTIQVWQAAGFASMFAFVMLLHVYTWFMIGVVMLPTFILLGLAITCLVTNLAAMIWRLNCLQFVYPWKLNR